MTPARGAPSGARHGLPAVRPLVRFLRSCFLFAARWAFVGLVLAGCGAGRSVTRASPSGAPRCREALRPLVPEGATQWVLVRPRAVFDHPRLGRALARAFDDAGEQALFSRAQRVGYDVRTVDRALLVWTREGFTAVGLGAFDSARLVDLLWERLLPPRRRAEAGRGRTRVEGILTRSPVALSVDGACGLASWAEGDTRRADVALEEPSTRRPEGAPPDPEALLVWHARDVPDAVRAPASDALIRRVHDLEVTVTATRDGALIELVLEGDVPDDAGARVRRALSALAASPLGEASGAWQWLGASAVTLTHDRETLRLRVTAPWRSLEALASALRGDVGHGALR